MSWKICPNGLKKHPRFDVCVGVGCARGFLPHDPPVLIRPPIHRGIVFLYPACHTPWLSDDGCTVDATTERIGCG